MKLPRAVIFNQGMAAFINGKPCIPPPSIGEDSVQAWVEGWLAALKEGLHSPDD